MKTKYLDFLNCILNNYFFSSRQTHWFLTFFLKKKSMKFMKTK